MNLMTSYKPVELYKTSGMSNLSVKHNVLIQLTVIYLFFSFGSTLRKTVGWKVVKITTSSRNFSTHFTFYGHDLDLPEKPKRFKPCKAKSSRLPYTYCGCCLIQLKRQYAMGLG
jgi:hypothetical protein